VRRWCRALAFLCCFASVAADGEDTSDNSGAEQQGGDDKLWEHIAATPRTTFAPYPRDASIIAAHVESKESWFGYLHVFHHTGSHVDWVAKLPKEYEDNCGNFLLSCSWVYLEKLDIYALEVFDSTHRGNGSYWLFALEGRELRVLINTWGVDSDNEDRDFTPPRKHPKDGTHPTRGTVILNGRLNAEYKVESNSQEVVLSGTIVTMMNLKAVSSREYAESWFWNPKSHAFNRLSQGFSPPLR